MKRAVTIFSITAVLAFGFMIAVQAQEKAPGVVILKGNPMGGVRFDHPAHAQKTGDKCDTCHHASQPAKPLKTLHQKCMDCHTKAVAAPMKTNSRLAFHDAMAKAGTCIGCHAKETAAGKTAPLKCVECHKKANG